MKAGLIAMLTTTIFLFIGDQVLGFIGLPGEIPIQVAHPRNFEEIRHNIEYQYTFKTNDQGLRYATIPLHKNPGERRVILLGDSFVEGVGLESSDTLGARLESEFTDPQGLRIRFINGGLSGTAPLEYWRLFYHVGRRYGPDGVLICVYGNDVSGMPEDLTREGLYKRVQYPPGSEVKRAIHLLYPRIYTLLQQAQLARETKADAEKDLLVYFGEVARRNGVKEDEITRWVSRLPSNLVAAARRHEFNGTIFGHGLLHPFFWTDALNIDTPRAERKFRSLVVALDEIVAVARAEGIEVGLLYIPSPLQYEARRHGSSEPWVIAGATVDRAWLSGESEVQNRLNTWAAERHVPYLDLTPAFRQQHNPAQPTNWPLDEHWTPYGSSLAASTISQWIRSGKVFHFIVPN